MSQQTSFTDINPEPSDDDHKTLAQLAADVEALEQRILAHKRRLEAYYDSQAQADKDELEELISIGDVLLIDNMKLVAELAQLNHDDGSAAIIERLNAQFRASMAVFDFGDNTHAEGAGWEDATFE